MTQEPTIKGYHSCAQKIFYQYSWDDKCKCYSPVFYNHTGIIEFCPRCGEKLYVIDLRNITD